MIREKNGGNITFISKRKEYDCKYFSRLNFSLFNESFLFSTDTFEQHRCWLIVGILWNELAVNSKVEYLCLNAFVSIINSLLILRSIFFQEKLTELSQLLLHFFLWN